MKNASETTDQLRTESRGRERSRERSRSATRQYRQGDGPQEHSLLRARDRAGATGRGRDILARSQPAEPALLCFLAHDRLRVPMANRPRFVSKNESKERRGKP